MSGGESSKEAREEPKKKQVTSEKGLPTSRDIGVERSRKRKARGVLAVRGKVDTTLTPMITFNERDIDKRKSEFYAETSSVECRLALGKDWSDLVSIETNPTQSRLSVDSDATESDRLSFG
ncbi:hypothetical protein CR513_12279, partial [Mucuna pruriens]